MRRLAIALTGAVALWAAAGVSVSADEQLIMIEEQGCFWCARWNAEISDIYPKTEEGQRAPLRRIDKRGPLPADLTLTRPATFTPTFILVRDGRELGRIEGYPGEDFFWGLLGMLLKDNPNFEGAG